MQEYKCCVILSNKLDRILCGGEDGALVILKAKLEEVSSWFLFLSITTSQSYICFVDECCFVN